MNINPPYVVLDDAHAPGETRAILDAIASGQLSRAEHLFSYAQENGIPVEVSLDGADILQCAIEESEEATSMILERLLSGCSTLADTCRVLSYNLPQMIQKYPRLMKEYLAMDRFAVEYGRFSLPSSLFRETSGQPIAMMTDEELLNWRAPGNVAAKNLWIRTCPKCLEAIACKKKRRQITVVAKLLCFDQKFSRQKRDGLVFGVNADAVSLRCRSMNFLMLLAKANLPLEIFNSESLKALTEWRFRDFRRRSWFVGIWHLASGKSTDLLLLRNDILS